MSESSGMSGRDRSTPIATSDQVPGRKESSSRSISTSDQVPGRKERKFKAQNEESENDRTIKALLARVEVLENHLQSNSSDQAGCVKCATLEKALHQNTQYIDRLTAELETANGMQSDRRMAMQDNLHSLGEFLKNLETGFRLRNIIKGDIENALYHFEAIKKKIQEDAKAFADLEKGKQQQKEEKTKMNVAEKGPPKPKTLQDLQKQIEDLQEENQNLKQDSSKRSGDEKLRQVDKLNDEKKKLQVEVEELTKRLSSVTGQQMTKNNPAIDDLSDPYRPTKLVEVFGLLYDNQWTDAFSSFEKKKRTENEIINILGEIIMRADRFCTESFLEVTDRIRAYLTDDIINPKVLIRRGRDNIKCVSRIKVGIESSQKLKAEGHINDQMQALAAVTGKQLADIFLQLPMDLVKTTFLQNEANVKSLDIFAEEAVKIIWMMKVQQPPMELVWVDHGSKYDKQMFSFYVSKGDTVAQCIWPAVLLHKGGPVMARGIVQGK